MPDTDTLTNRPRLKTSAMLGLALAYVVTGKLGLLLALPPGYASAVFPPAGIGLAMVLLGGSAALPWVFGSALLLNLWIGHDAGAHWGLVSVSSALAIGMASSLQAAVGGHVLNRKLGQPIALASSHELMRFALYVPLICLIGASISVASLFILGVVQSTDAWLHWLTWWLGDMLGVMLALPAVLVFLGEPEPLWRARASTVLLPVAIGFALLLGGFNILNRWEHDSNLNDFETLTQKTHDELKLRFDLQESLLDETQTLFSLPGKNGAQEPTRAQFRHFVQTALDRYSSIQAIEWAPSIGHAERARFELAQRADLPGFEFRERDADGKMQRANTRERYQPVSYVEPLRGNELAVGFDLASNPARKKAILLALNTQSVVATAPIKLVQEKQNQAGLLLIQAVKQGPRKGDIVLSVLRMGDFVSDVADLTRGQVAIRLIDVEADKPLFDSFPEGASQTLEVPLVLGTRHYTLQTTPTPMYYANHRSWQSWVVLVIGLFGTALLSGFLLLGTGQKAYAEVLVEERTRELRKRELALNNAQKIARLGSWEWNIETGDLYWSDEIYRLFGFEPQQFEPTYAKFLERIHPDDRKGVEDAVARALDGTENYQVEHRIVLPTGEERYAEELGEIERDASGKPIHMVGTVHDITERKRVDRMKSEFISTVSHELRTPLTSIRGSLGLVSGGVMGELPEQVQSMLAIASNNTERLLMLINDILDIQKIEAGKMGFSFENLSLMPLLEQSISDLSTYAMHHGVRFEITSRLDNAHIYGDRARLMQVLANLMSNAAKFSPPHSRIEIAAAQHHRGYIRISITDFGSGIPESFKTRIFQPFSQSDSSDTRAKGGTGLGLAISKAIVEKHGGQISFVSREGIGTTFYIDLPEMRDAGLGAPPRALPSEHRACVLIVEDDPDVAALIQRMLATASFDSDIAYSAAEARELLARNGGNYQLMTLDLQMPGEGGISLLQDLRRDPATRDLPVVIVSVMADEAKQQLSGGALNVLDWLSKPIDAERLIALVKQTCSVGKTLPSVLHVEDEPDVCSIVNRLVGEHCKLSTAQTLAAARQALERETFDLVLLDIGLPDGSGLDLIETVKELPHPPRIVIFSANDVDAAHASQVSAVLVKSKTDNKALLNKLIENMRGEA